MAWNFVGVRSSSRVFRAATLPVLLLATGACGGHRSGGGVQASGGAGASATSSGGSSGSGVGGGNGGNSGTGANAGESGNPGGAGNGGAGSEELPELSWRPDGTPAIWNGISFLVPRGMEGGEAAGGYEMVRQTPFGEDQLVCVLRIEPARSAAADLSVQALEIMTEFFAAEGISLVDQRGGTDLLAHRVHGFSPRGWEFIELTAEPRPDGVPTLARARILLVHLGSAVLPIIAVASHYEGCVRFDYERNLGTTFDPQLDWAAFFWGLELPTEPVDSALIEQVLIGKWSEFSAHTLAGEIYAANHRYASDATWASEREVSPTELELTTTTWSGEGRYVVDRDTLARFPDSGVADANLFHFVERYAPPETLGPGQTNPGEELHQMRASTLSGGTSLPYDLVLGRVVE
jgi:hypothetical protein